MQRDADRPVLMILAEDNDDHAELVLRYLAAHPSRHTILHLRDGQAVLDYMLRNGPYSDPATSPQPHLILLDLRLPKVDGIDVLRTLKSTAGLHHIPIVVLTTSAADQDIARAYEHRANSYLVKPVDPDGLGRLVDALGFYWLTWNRYAPAP